MTASQAVGYSVDVLTQRRLDCKREHVRVHARIQQQSRERLDVATALPILREQLNETRGASNALQLLHAKLPYGVVHALAFGQAEGLRRKLVQLKTEHATAAAKAAVVTEAVSAESMRAAALQACMDLFSHFLAMQTGGGFSVAAARQVLAQQKAAAITELHAATQRVSTLFDRRSQRVKVTDAQAEARGGEWALSMLRTAFLQYKHTRLQRRRQEALGMCFATAQATTAHRLGKRMLAEVTGGRELLRNVQTMHASRPHTMLELAVQLPLAGSGRADRRAGSPPTQRAKPPSPNEPSATHMAAARCLIDDTLSWMGWPDAVLTYADHKLCPSSEPGAQGAIRLVVIARVNACPELEVTLGSGDPRALGERVLDECSAGRLNPGLAATAACLDQASVAIASATLHVPLREDVRRCVPTLSHVESCLASALAENESVVEEATRQVEAQSEKERAQQHTKAATVHGAPLGRTVEQASPRKEAGSANATQQSAAALATKAAPPQAARIASHASVGSATAAASAPAAVAAETSGSEAAQELAASVAASRHALAAAAAFGAAGGMHSLGGVRLADGVLGGKWGGASSQTAADGALRIRMQFLAMASPQARLAHARTTRDVLRGQLVTLRSLRQKTGWGALTCPGDQSPVDQMWNLGVGTSHESQADDLTMGIGTRVAAPAPAGAPTVARPQRPLSSGASGRFCAFCAQRMPPLLARHPFVDCYRRMLWGVPQYSSAAVEELEGELSQREGRTAKQLALYEIVIARRVACVAAFHQIESAIGRLGRACADALRLEGASVILPASNPPRTHHVVGRFGASVHGHLHSLLRELEGDAPEPLPGIDMHPSRTWNRLKATLIMTPRPSLVPGGAFSRAPLHRGANAVCTPQRETDLEPDSTATAHAVCTPQRETDLEPDSTATAHAVCTPQRETDLEPDSTATAHAETLSDVAICEAGAEWDAALADLEAVGNDVPAASDADAPSAGAVAGLGLKGGSLRAALWAEGSSRVLTPDDVLASARILGVALPGTTGCEPARAEYHLLPLVVELLRAPLPNGWQEVECDGVWMFREGATQQLHTLHPLTDAFAAVTAHERRRRRLGKHYRYPAWLSAAAEHMMQFVAPDGALYTYNFAENARAPPPEAIVRSAMQGDSDESSFAAVAAEESSGASFRRLPLPSQEEDAASATRERTREAAGLGKEVDANGAFGRLLGQRMLQRAGETMPGSEKDDVLRQRLHAALHAAFDPLVGASLAHMPRPLSATLEAAISLGIDVGREPHYLWLADLAHSLPVPIGWEQLAHPLAGRPDFWHNPLLGCSQWQHPVDHLIKGCLHSLRAPRSPRAVCQMAVWLGEEVGDGAANAAHEGA